MHVYSNGDLMVEASGKKDETKLLILASRKRLYSGVPDDEIKKGHSFMFFDYGFAYPILALQEAYPKGPAGVPEKEIEIPVLLEKEHAAKVIVRRLSSEKIQYKLTMPRNTLMEGFWEGRIRAPLADSLALQEWKDSDLKTFATLG